MSSQFHRGLQKSLNWCRDHVEEAFAQYAKTQTQKTARVLEWEWQAWQKTAPLLPHSQQPNYARWLRLQQWMAEHQMMKYTPDLQAFLSILKSDSLEQKREKIAR